MCPAAPPPESSRAPASEAAVQRAGSGVAGALGAGPVLLGAALSVDASPVVPAGSLGLALGLADEVLAGGAGSCPVEPCGPHAASDAPRPTTAASANILPMWGRPAGVRCAVVITPLLRSRFPESTSPAAEPRPALPLRRDLCGSCWSGKRFLLAFRPTTARQIKEGGLRLAGGAQERQAAHDQPGQPRPEAQPGRPSGAAVVRGR